MIGHDDAGQHGVRRVGDVDPLDDLARENSWDVFDADRVEPVEEHPGAQQIDDRLAVLDSNRDQHPTLVDGRGMYDHVMGAHLDQPGPALFEDGGRTSGIGYAVVQSDHQ